ncbi:MAG: leucine-rich repeat domain-containing protein [Oscillospiraceae bacterium]|nr:leucine-rich repeat domain-containing protein [Oscillospiraceae bacterium]
MEEIKLIGIRKFLCGGAIVCAAVLACSAAVFPAAADAEESAAAEEEESSNQIQTYTSGDYVYSILIAEDDENEKAASIESYVGTETVLTIPSELEGLPVVRLGDNAFTSNYELKEVTLPETLTEFGDFPFAECPSLTAFHVAKGNKVFESRDGVLYTDDGDTLLRYPIGADPVDVEIPKGVKGIGNVAFACAPHLKSVTFPDSVETIGVSAFSNCESLESIVIPPKVTEIEAFTFNSCSSLRNVTLPDGLIRIGNAAFAATIINDIIIPDGCEDIGQQAFAETKLPMIEIPSSVWSIGYCAFGYKLNDAGQLVMDDSFIIYGTYGSEAQRYAGEEGEDDRTFQFIAVDPEPTDSGDKNKQQENDKTDSKAFRYGGIGLCGVLLAAIIIVAIRNGKKKKSGAENVTADEKDETAADEVGTEAESADTESEDAAGDAAEADTEETTEDTADE